jgi:hypothetical protein
MMTKVSVTERQQFSEPCIIVTPLLSGFQKLAFCDSITMQILRLCNSIYPESNALTVRKSKKNLVAVVVPSSRKFVY